MRFATRTLLLCFVPFAVLLMGSFWAIQKLVESTVKSGLRSSLRENQLAIARLRSQAELQNNRFLRVAGENASLKAGLQLLQLNPANAEARGTVEDQLEQLCEEMGFDFLSVSDPDGKPLAGAMRTNSGIRAVAGGPAALSQRGLMTVGDNIYQIATVPIDQGDENLGLLSVGERFDLSELKTPSVLLRNGRVLKSSVQGIGFPALAAALRSCGERGDCEVRIGRQSYISLSMNGAALGDGYDLRSLQNVDAATAPVQKSLNRVFGTAAIGTVLIALMFSFLSSQTIVQPITAMIDHLRASERTGLLPEFTRELSPIREIRELTSSFNRAAGAIRDARANLQSAYLEFVGSLASALDARDRYTAGHSGRVSDLSCATALAMGMTGQELNDLRIGALLHDIGKIGIADSVLQKPSRLTTEEFAIVKQHPEIGRRILEGVHGFAPYLAAVELHHENWDGTGYPQGQSGKQTPLAARIIHVCDAYDAMTSDRPYRRGMSHREAISVLRQFAGSQFDPHAVDAFVEISADLAPPDSARESLLELADSVNI
ncbi:MAG TPA: HD-GYP domain-containing protein [Bryobacteraceae bacterium]|nr:HD-GYP domain-containing protein [Bryobacteraceae bacterium]